MALAAYQPKLGKIQEEPDDPEELIDFDESILLEYAILTEEDLRKALYIDNPTDGSHKMGCTCGEKSEWCTFSAFHGQTGVKNTKVVQYSLSRDAINKHIHSPIHRPQNGSANGPVQVPLNGHAHDRAVQAGRKEEDPYGNCSDCSDLNSGSSTSIIHVCEEQDLHVRVLNDYDYGSTCNSLNGNDSGIHNDSRDNSICSNVRSLNGSISESMNKSINGSINESLFNLDSIIKTSPNQPLERQGIDFNTVTGRKVFIKAIRQKYMNIYYVVSQQRLSGDFIGNQSVATFVMVLNALEIKQNELKGAYFQTHSLNDEMTFTDVASVARDNKLSAEVSQVFKGSSIFNFRKAVKLSCKSSNILLLCHYHINSSRGQFSFIGGYFKDKDTVLVLTPSKSKFIARWIPTLLMWKILLNQATGEEGAVKACSSGGYMLIQRNETNPRIAVRINKKALLCLEPPSMTNSQDFETLLSNWTLWLALPATDTTDDVILQAINYVVNNLNLNTAQSNTVVVGTANVRRIVECKLGSLTDIISKTKVYNAVKNQIDSLSSDSLKKLEVFSEWIVSMTYSSSIKNADKKTKVMNFKKIRKKPTKGGSSRIIYKDNLMLAMCLIFWPYAVGQVNTNAASLAQSVHPDLESFPWDTMIRIQEQMRLVVRVMQSSFNSDRIIQF